MSSPCRLLHWPRTDYGRALVAQQRIHAARVGGEIMDTLIVTEHFPVLTRGLSSGPGEIYASDLPVVATDRGGKTSYHGPGQVILYPILDLKPHQRQVARYVWQLEEVAVRVMDHFGVAAIRDPRAPGVWVEGAKVAALGVRIRRGVTYHGLALNHAPELDHYAGILPCGLARPVTSLEMLGVRASRREVVEACTRSFAAVFDRDLLPDQDDP